MTTTNLKSQILTLSKEVEFDLYALDNKIIKQNQRLELLAKGYKYLRIYYESACKKADLLQSEDYTQRIIALKEEYLSLDESSKQNVYKKEKLIAKIFEITSHRLASVMKYIQFYCSLYGIANIKENYNIYKLDITSEKITDFDDLENQLKENLDQQLSAIQNVIHFKKEAEEILSLREIYYQNAIELLRGV